MAPSPASRIVVGVDGSAHSLLALRWAAREAALRGARIIAVWAVDSDNHGAESAVLASAVSSALGASPDVTVEQRICHGPPEHQLLDLAADAALLVVGSRGHSDLAGRILGSTAIAIARTSPVPVVVVPDGTNATPRAGSLEAIDREAAV